ncbi:hypothetical protein Dimus_013670, partial [Dionaea muscipula]
QQAKRKGDSRGVDPSATKQQKSERKKDEKKKEKEVFFDSSNSENDEIFVVKAFLSEIIIQKRVIRGKIIREGRMNDNDLINVMSLIKKQKWENLFKRRELMHTAACKEFYANLTVFIYKKKEIAISRVKGVEIEFDNMKLTSILNVPGHTGISEYINEVWEESKYIKPLEITKKFANNSLINVARRVQSIEMKPFQRFVHFVVMKNVVSRFGKRDTTSYMDLIYIDHLIARRLVNLPKVMMRHMSCVISVKDHELLIGPRSVVKERGIESKIEEY